ncbi:DEKNAAC105028 [Brettanomyces naardenensis]|uniref:Sm protein B n=1 Tax=Brettanomyces naardenensis TaxID=13370 RepID=A0A448YRY9_BRENA|nr:DEKNAAC105028 [Brettanomyces naardenensis]
MAIGQIPRKAKLATLLNFKVRVTTTNSSQFIGTLISFDRYMNLVLVDCEEFRLTKKSQGDLRKQTRQNKRIIDESGIKEQKRLLGLVILRGEGIVSVVVEAAPNVSNLKPRLRLNKGKGTVKPAIKTLKSEQRQPGRLNTPIRAIGGVSKPSQRR